MKKSQPGNIGMGKSEFIKDHTNVLKIKVSDLYDIIYAPLSSLIGTKIFSIELLEGSILYINTLDGDYKIVEQEDVRGPFEGDLMNLVGGVVLSVEGNIIATNKGIVRLNWTSPLERL